MTDQARPKQPKRTFETKSFKEEFGIEPTEEVSVGYTDARGIQVHVKMPLLAAELWRLELGMEREEFFNDKFKKSALSFQPLFNLFDINDTQGQPPTRIKVDIGIFVFQDWSTAEVVIRIMKFGLHTKDVLSQPLVLTPWVYQNITGQDTLGLLTAKQNNKFCINCNTYFRTEELKTNHGCKNVK